MASKLSSGELNQENLMKDAMKFATNTLPTPAIKVPRIMKKIVIQFIKKIVIYVHSKYS